MSLVPPIVSSTVTRGLGRAATSSQPRSDGRHSLGRCHHRNDFELHQVLPPSRPFRQELPILALHDLKAAAKVVCDPTRHVPEALGRQSPLVAKPAVHRQGISAAKMLDHHVRHSVSCKSRVWPTSLWLSGAREGVREGNPHELSRRSFPSAKDREIGPPWSHCRRVLACHHTNHLTNVTQVVGHPC